MSKDVRIRSYFSNPKEVREHKSLGNTALQYSMQQLQFVELSKIAQYIINEKVFGKLLTRQVDQEYARAEFPFVSVPCRFPSLGS